MKFLCSILVTALFFAGKVRAQTVPDDNYVVGKWSLSFGKDSEWNPKYSPKDSSDWSYEFLTEGIYHYKQSDNSIASGSWKVNKNVLILKEGEKETPLEIIVISPVWFQISYQKGDTEEETIYIHMRKL